MVHLFARVFDVVVVGSGMAGYAAAMSLRQGSNGAATRVLLIGPRGDLVWEAGRCFAADAGQSDDPQWTALRDAVADRGGAADGWLDGAITEVVATDRLTRSGASVLYYAHPVAIERDGDAMAGLIVATKSGLRRVVGRQWIDATEEGFLLKRMNGGEPRAAAARRMWLYLQHDAWTGESPRPTAWPTERVLELELKRDSTPWQALKRVLTRLEGQPREALMSHCSAQPLPVYAARQTRLADVANVAAASPAWADGAMDTLADRHALGVAAARRLADLLVHEAEAAPLARPIPAVQPAAELDVDVVVAGAGTGGALAAIAAGRAGARTLCLEPMSFPGGIGSGGGIHTYYFGVTGGMQQEIDRRVKALMDEVGRPLSGGPFNPEAKKIILEEAIRAAGVDLRYDTLLYDVEMGGERVTRVFAATPDGPVAIRCHSAIDGTGDGDLAARAGARFTLGREGDGLPHAYSQSSGRLRRRDHDGPAMAIVNFDAGWCDPTDPEDFTRARLVGITQYLLDRYDNDSRPTYIAPAIGLRQARQVITDHVLSLTDLVERRSFTDCIGYTGCHYDNHAVDYEFESDEAMFWIWLCRNWRNPMACEISYRMLLPVGLDNVYLASRCLGVSQDAHHAMRMQRDMQRIGEAAGYAAALAAKHGVPSRAVPMDELQAMLKATGAIVPPDGKEPPIFNKTVDLAQLEPKDLDRELQGALAALDAGEPDKPLWWLYRHEDRVGEAVRQRLGSANRMTSWLAAGICAMWNDAAAEPRLMTAVTEREYGYGEGWQSPHLHGNEGFEPMKNKRLAPNWLVAVCLLRRCGTAACVPALRGLAELPDQSITTRCAIASALQRLADRGQVDAATAGPILHRLLEGTMPGERGIPQRMAGAIAQTALCGESEVSSYQTYENPPSAHGTLQDYRWQLDLTVARVRVAVGLPVHDAALALRDDPRSLVRRAIERVLERAGAERQRATVAS